MIGTWLNQRYLPKLNRKTKLLPSLRSIDKAGSRYVTFFSCWNSTVLLDRHDSEINELSLFLHGISLLCNHLITVDGESNDLTRLLFHIARFNKRLEDFKLVEGKSLRLWYRQAYSALVAFLDSYVDFFGLMFMELQL